jgi:DNA-binding NtrC family response regulator
MVADGTFRQDLYYRLNVIPIHLPPLRTRKDDIPLLVQHFLQRFCREMPAPARPGALIAPLPPKPGAQPGGPWMTVSQQAMRKLMAYGWPGNVRQLENALERAVALSAGRTQIEAADLPPEVQQAVEVATGDAFMLPDDGLDFPEYIRKIERDVIEQSLERTGGNKGAAAKLLNLKRTTLVEKLKRLDRES